jgi:monoamine oxidase
MAIERSSDILIVGAGAAGLAAAAELSRHGRQVIVVEARDRIGGRVFTCLDKMPVAIELGAEFIHGRAPEIWETVQSKNIPICDVAERHWYFEDGELSRSHDFWKKIDELMARMKLEADDRSLKDFLDSLPDDSETQRAKAMAARYVQGFHAAKLERIGIQGLAKDYQAADEIDGDHSFRIPGGYYQLLETLNEQAQSHGALIYLETIAKEIRWKRGHIEAVCETANGIKTFAAATALITLPLGVLQSGALGFSPPLPESTRVAIASLAVGDVIRISLYFRERFWESLEGKRVDFFDLGFVHCPEAPVPTWWTQLPMRVPLLVGWAGGPKADALKSKVPAFIIEQALDSLAHVLGVSVRQINDQLIAPYFHNWSKDPFALGAYSYVPVDGLRAQESMSQPIQETLVFAGEALAVGHVGTVHGALQTGRDAARKIMMW